ncbi:MAG: TonB family protein [Bradymonadales bacterium]|nr:TonB family protein [Bradymonadales bacterium]
MDRQTSTKRWLVFLLLALLVHVAVLSLLMPWILSDDSEPPIPPACERPTELVLRTEPSQRQSGRQIVSIDQPPTEEIPEDARFEDRYNRSVERETVSRQRGTAPEAVPPLADRPQPDEIRPPPERDRRHETPASRHRRREQPEAQTALQVESELTRSRQSREAQPEQQETPATPPPDPLPLAAFSPTLESASDLFGIPGEYRIDHLNLPQGDRTEINSIENLYWSYWDRLKNQVRPYWRPAHIYRMRDPSGRIYGVEDRYTVVRVTLNGDGSLRHLFLERSSDLDFLDREAMQAIRQAEPFANVPEGLKDERGLLSFRFGFYFEVSSSSFRIRREDW